MSFTLTGRLVRSEGFRWNLLAPHQIKSREDTTCSNRRLATRAPVFFSGEIDPGNNDKCAVWAYLGVEGSESDG